ncbi:E3 ubiquitin-protein ligase RNF126 [Galdieria sulphuraria]|uniref:Zinc finger (C3HC4-type RING finger) family protein n=1 Tax=Galdieria sulphuraria TaxID=130081 RepID=M2XSQ3_GALSU|nr:zinc finger (C3HC4-type RING finger) family protein [Galdieria sulphuraria]EME26703.1 zinc finger (C3HC4-type RING finger) family protein [Galdieria sulphuraria]GJD05551.1 E3 ubiquitin-protein ligase RNF126 [Galdieria sulphuraria]|eukprot:XP_005703223.1 zinc finger (C3HC4-type RING finger) family protein [Galdieria sulphuraria]
MSSSRAKRRRVPKTRPHEEVIDLVSSSDNSPELVSSTRNVWSTSLTPDRSSSSCPSQEPNRRVASSLESSFAETVEEPGSHNLTTSLPNSRRSNLLQATQVEAACLDSSTVASRPIAISTERMPHLAENTWNLEQSGRRESLGESSLYCSAQRSAGMGVSCDWNGTEEPRSERPPLGDNIPRYYRRNSQYRYRPVENVGETRDTGSTSGIQTRSGRSYTTRSSTNPRMNIQRRILEAERRSLSRESGHRQTSSGLRQATSTRRNRILSGGPSSSRSISRSLNAWIEYFRQVNPWLLLSFHEGDFTADDYQMLLQLDEKVENKRGASKSVIDSIPCVEVSESEMGESCCICLDDYVLGESLKRLPCNHIYHKACIEQWLIENACCPIDKERIDGENWQELLK